MALRRSLFAAALAAVVALPSLAHAQQARSARPGAPALSVGGGVGLELGLGDTTGFGLRVDGVYPLQNLTPQITLGLAGQLGYTYFSDDQDAFGSSVEASTHLFKAVPALRAGFQATPLLSLYGDAGLGLYFGRTSVEVENAAGRFEDSDSEIGLMIRVAAGGLYAVSPRLDVGAEIGLNPYFGDVDDTSFTLFGVLLYKL